MKGGYLPACLRGNMYQPSTTGCISVGGAGCGFKASNKIQPGTSKVAPVVLPTTERVCITAMMQGQKSEIQGNMRKAGPTKASQEVDYGEPWHRSTVHVAVQCGPHQSARTLE
eukprot:1735013-Ditylum_brightwellii.AAC.1